MVITHLLFVDDILIFRDGSWRSLQTLRHGLGLFHIATGVEINEEKSSISRANLSEEAFNYLEGFFHFPCSPMDDGVKYLGFFLKLNEYRKGDWKWLLRKTEKRIKVWSHKWLSRASRLVLVKVVLEAMPLYWMALTWIPRGILGKIRKICFSFPWGGSYDKKTMPWVRWACLAFPKALGGWGLQFFFVFSKALATKAGWRLIKSTNLWT